MEGAVSRIAAGIKNGNENLATYELSSKSAAFNIATNQNVKNTMEEYQNTVKFLEIYAEKNPGKTLAEAASYWKTTQYIAKDKNKDITDQEILKRGAARNFSEGFASTPLEEAKPVIKQEEPKKDTIKPKPAKPQPNKKKILGNDPPPPVKKVGGKKVLGDDTFIMPENMNKEVLASVEGLHNNVIDDNGISNKGIDTPSDKELA
jgi:hypothetical protein